MEEHHVQLLLILIFFFCSWNPASYGVLWPGYETSIPGAAGTWVNDVNVTFFFSPFHSSLIVWGLFQCQAFLRSHTSAPRFSVRAMKMVVMISSEIKRARHLTPQVTITQQVILLTLPTLNAFSCIRFSSLDEMYGFRFLFLFLILKSKWTGFRLVFLKYFL
jgi:hypothetical protein